MEIIPCRLVADRSRLQRLHLHRAAIRLVEIWQIVRRGERNGSRVTFNDPGYRMAEDKRDRYPGMCRGSLISSEVSPKYKLSHDR